MRATILCAVALSISAGTRAGDARTIPVALTSQRWMIDGVERTGLVAAPSKPIPESGAPLVFVFHGHGGTSLNISRTFGVHTEWPDAVVIYLQGLPTPGAIVDPAGTLAGWQNAPGAFGDRDLKLFDSVLTWAKRTYRIDPKRIYAAGHSNGAWFTYVLWAARGDVFAAFAPAAAAFGQMITAAKPKPAFIVAGELDALVPIALQRRNISAILRLDQCDTVGSEWATNAKLYRSKNGADVVAYVHPGGHPLPADVAALAVRFFKAH